MNLLDFKRWESFSNVSISQLTHISQLASKIYREVSVVRQCMFMCFGRSPEGEAIGFVLLNPLEMLLALAGFSFY